MITLNRSMVLSPMGFVTRLGRVGLLVGITGTFASGCTRSNVQVGEVPPPPPVRVVAVDATLVEQSREMVREALASDEPLTRANAIEAAELLNADELDAVVLRLLDDSDARVRYAAAMAGGRQKVSNLQVRARLAEMADGQSPNGRVAAVFALHMLGDTTRSQRLVDYTQSADPTVRANAAVALGLTGAPSAADVLAAMLQDPDGNVALNAAEGLWRLGDKRGLQPLMTASISQFTDDNVIGVLALGGNREPQVWTLLKSKLNDDYPEVALSAARALGRIGSDAGYMVAATEAAAIEPRRRALAALAFGDIGRLDAQDMLRPLLDDADADVRLAAATAMLRLAGNSNDAFPAAATLP